jgi:NAD(P)-dependent dehydrogenase (short-subunit alcohol dehydrogenase family)
MSFAVCLRIGNEGGAAGSVFDEERGVRTMTDGIARVALVTGGARRIGRAISLALHRAGYAVVIHTDRSVAEAAALRDEIAREGGRANVVRANLADAAALAGLVAEAGAAGPLTLLVNNAAMFEPDEIGTLDATRFDRQFAVNLRAPLFLAEAFAAQAPTGADASVVNILDQRVFKLTPQFVSYTLAKSALHAATRMLAQALAPPVRVNAVAPGPTMASARQDAADFARQSEAVPLGRGPTPEEIAAAVVYLAGARSMTGATLVVDGGQHLSWQTPDAVTKE